MTSFSFFSHDHPAAGIPSPVDRTVAMTDQGLAMGDGSILVRMTKGRGPAHLAFEADRDRFLAMMSVVDGRSIGIDALRHVEAADRFWRRGDKALANLRLIFADLPRLAARADAYRLALAEHLLDEGMAPVTLLKEIGLTLATEALKYAPDQPRVPAGHGRESGQFTYGNDTGDGIVVASNSGQPEDEKTVHLHESEGSATSEELVTHGHPITPTTSLPTGVGVGPYARRLVPAGPGPKPRASQQREINEDGYKFGCHTCGTKNPGTSSGNFVCDHQDPNKLNPPGKQQYYLPQCKPCSDRQGGKVRHLNPSID